MERSTNKHFLDIAYQSNIMRFYTKGEVEKMGGLLESGGLLDDEQKTAFKRIDNKIDSYIKTVQSATDESAYKEIANMIFDVVSDMDNEIKKLGVHGGAIKMLADEFRNLGNRVNSCISQ